MAFSNASSKARAARLWRHKTLKAGKQKYTNQTSSAKEQIHDCMHALPPWHQQQQEHGTQGERSVEANLPLGVVAHGVLVAHTVVGLEAAHGQLCVSGPIHGALIDVG